MKRAFLLAALLIAMTVLSGCYRTSFTYTDRGAAAVTEDSQKFFINGLVGPKKPFRADQLCPSGIAGVETYATFGNGCATMCTATIFSPRTVKVTCAAGGAHNFYLDENDNVLAHETITPDGETAVEDFTSDVL